MFEIGFGPGGEIIEVSLITDNGKGFIPIYDMTPIIGDLNASYQVPLRNRIELSDEAKKCGRIEERWRLARLKAENDRRTKLERQIVDLVGERRWEWLQDQLREEILDDEY